MTIMGLSAPETRVLLASASSPRNHWNDRCDPAALTVKVAVLPSTSDSPLAASSTTASSATMLVALLTGLVAVKK